VRAPNMKAKKGRTRPGQIRKKCANTANAYAAQGNKEIQKIRAQGLRERANKQNASGSEMELRRVIKKTKKRGLGDKCRREKEKNKISIIHHGAGRGTRAEGWGQRG